jgi:hypothetical protein
MGDRKGGCADLKGRPLSPSTPCPEPGAEHEGGELPSLVMWPSLAPDARPLDRGKPRDEDTEGGHQPAHKSLINRRLSLRSQLCADEAFPADAQSVGTVKTRLAS